MKGISYSLFLDFPEYPSARNLFSLQRKDDMNVRLLQTVFCKCFAFENQRNSRTVIDKTALSATTVAMEPEDHSDGPIAEMVRWWHSLQGYWCIESLKRKQRSGTVNWVNMIHTHQRQSNVPRSLSSNMQTDKPSTNSVEDKWKRFEGRPVENIIFSSKEAYVIFPSPPKSKGYMLRIQSQTHI